MKRLSLFVSALLILTSLSFSQKLTDNLPLDPNVVSGTLPNGLKYFIKQNKRPEKRAELRLAVNVGSVLEDDDQLGLAHLTEHMAFNGTKNFHKMEIVNFLERIGMRFGADVNAYTSFDETVYMIQVPTDTVALVEKGIQILEDWAHNVSFEGEEIDKERGVVIEEWRLGRGAEARMFDKQIPVILKDSRYADRLTIGKKEILESFPHDRIRQFYKDWYRPELMSVVAVGDFDVKEMERSIKEHFSNIPSATNLRERMLFPVPDHKEHLFTITSDPEATSSRVSVMYKHPLEPEKTAGDYRRHIVEMLYDALLNNRLYELTKQPDPPFTGAYSNNGGFVRTKGMYSLGASVKNNGIERGLEAVLTEALRVKKFGFTATEFDRQKKEDLRFIERAYNERDKTESRQLADELVRYFLDDEFTPGIAAEFDLYKKFMPEITLDEINKLAGEYLTDENRVVSVNSPAKEGVVVPTEMDLQNVFDKIALKDIQPYVDKVSNQPLVSAKPKAGKIAEESVITSLNITEWKLSNGVHVILKPTDFKNDEIFLSSYSQGGSSLVPDKQFISASMATSIVQEAGVAGFDNITLQKMLQGKIVGVFPYIGELEEGFNGSCSPTDFETMMQLVYLYATSPRYDSTAFISFKTRMKSIMQNRNLRPESALEDTLRVTMAQHHFRSRPYSEGILDELDLKTVYDIYKNRFADCSDFTFILVGNFNVNDIKPFVLTYLGGLPSGKRKEHWKDVGMVPPKGDIEKDVFKGIEQKGAVRIVLNGPFEWSRENRQDLQAMINVLRIKLREILREDKGGVYGVSISAAPIHFPRQEYRITVSFGCDPKRSDELKRAVFEQFDSLRNVGTTDDYILKVKESQIRERETNLKENRFWLSTLQFGIINNEDPEVLINKYNEMIDRITKERVQATAKKYLDMKNVVKVVLAPAQKSP